ncbi:ABC transporter permease [Paenibacillus selenitireducens]|uniref:ABC transporter permease n=1 Tax=Paenibacillus selenitireducens TaxID=1324314 RepID=A0A1T2XJA9_9BACL|nr:ABC transporter permease [Paenibacillus selenitireducens]OPA79971.1 ABC transporter permease [Paenibacillus selenitireducens]
MRLRDYISIGWDQLKRRKVVTAMCTIGIAIGSAAIIVALSLGESAQQYAQDQVNAFLKTDEITIMNKASNGSADPSTEQTSDRDVITKQKVDIIRQLPHVKAVGTYKDLGNFPFKLDDDKEGRVELTATNLDSLEAFDNSFQQGGISEQENTIILSYGAMMGLTDPVSQEMREKQLNANPNDESLWETYRELGKIVTPLYQKQLKLQVDATRDLNNPKIIEIPVRVVGVLKKPSGVSENQIPYMKQAYISHELAEQIVETMKTARSGTDLQPELTANFSRAVVKVDDVKNVQGLDDTIKKLRVSPQNNLSQQDRLKDQFAIVRTIALGVGLFVLFIASISIVVAMTMSTYQRRRQIGIMKVLGANLAQIRNMFIVESALLGLIGGIFGILFSYWVVWGINALLMMTDPSEEGSIIFISSWILGVGVFFAVLTGVLSGIYPAISASRTDALTAIKRD